MIGTVAALWLSLAISVGVGLFILKDEVHALQGELDRLGTEIEDTRRSIHVLNAEWTHLNDPVRLRTLAEERAGLVLMRPENITVIDALPFRGQTSPAPAATAGRPVDPEQAALAAAETRTE